ncbi:hypothetical protein ACFLU4_05430 [Chloroflexota bacterium]
MMDNVKVFVNLKDGVIQLEGPEEFVEKHLVDLREWIAGKIPKEHGKKEELEKAPKLVESMSEERPKKTTRVKRPKSGPACGEKTRELIREGFLRAPKSRADIQEELKTNKGVIYESKLIAATLKNMFNRGRVLRINDKGTLKYYVNE